MQNRWDDKEAKNYKNDPLAMRVYSSRLLGVDQNLVLHGGGNTSVKIDDYLYVKGSGWDLASIEKEGFPAVYLKTLKAMAELNELSDTDMVQDQREAMRDKSYPNPSVEAILHAIIPFNYVDHTHANSVVTISNTLLGKKHLSELYGENVLIIDYVMPGFVLAREIHNQTRGIDWSKLEAIILLNHGIFTFDNNPKKSYEKMISLVQKAEDFLNQKAPLINFKQTQNSISDDELKEFSKITSPVRGKEVKATVLDSDMARYFSSKENVLSIIHRGPLTPEHVIRTKAYPMVVESDFSAELLNYMRDYKTYFDAYAKDEVMLDLAPRIAIIKNRGIVLLGCDDKENKILSDIFSHTIEAMIRTENLGGWYSLDKNDIFDMEYWELEQAKLKKS